MDYKTPLVQAEQIEQAILLIRGQRVMMGRDLAALYRVPTSNPATLHQQSTLNYQLSQGGHGFGLRVGAGRSQLANDRVLPACPALAGVRDETGRAASAIDREL